MVTATTLLQDKRLPVVEFVSEPDPATGRRFYLLRIFTLKHFRYESRHLRHCLGKSAGEQYCLQVARGASEIFSLREFDSDRPRVTFEYWPNARRINQAKTYYNRSNQLVDGRDTELLRATRAVVDFLASGTAYDVRGRAYVRGVDDAGEDLAKTIQLDPDTNRSKQPQRKRSERAARQISAYRLDALYREIFGLPPYRHVFRESLCFHGERDLTSLAPRTYIAGSLDLEGSGVSKLPPHLTIEGNLNLRGLPLRALPNTLRVSGWIDIADTKIQRIPRHLKGRLLTLK